VTHDELLRYCLAKPGAWQDEPWEGDVVAKVGSKIFAFLGAGVSVGVKCGRSREDADEWLARYPQDAAAMPYVGRHGWNSLRLSGAIPDDDCRGATAPQADPGPYAGAGQCSSGRTSRPVKRANSASGGRSGPTECSATVVAPAAA
jgi:predicted DNA-binding protein (MmcQ/YjbR family)